jgi:hypothetical protein
MSALLAVAVVVLAAVLILDARTSTRDIRTELPLQPYEGGRHTCDFSSGEQINRTTVRFMCSHCWRTRDVYDPPPPHG